MRKHLMSVIVVLASVLCSCRSGQEQVMNPTDDTSQFVTLTDVVPDAILEIRYFGTYNFVGDRIDGYLQPTALLTKRAADSHKKDVQRLLQCLNNLRKILNNPQADKARS